MQKLPTGTITIYLNDIKKMIKAYYYSNQCDEKADKVAELNSIQAVSKYSRILIYKSHQSRASETDLL